MTGIYNSATHTVKEYQHYLKLIKAILICIGVADYSVNLAPNAWLQYYSDGYKAHEAIIEDFEMTGTIYTNFPFPLFSWEKTNGILKKL